MLGGVRACAARLTKGVKRKKHRLNGAALRFESNEREGNFSG